MQGLSSNEVGGLTSPTIMLPVGVGGKKGGKRNYSTQTYINSPILKPVLSAKLLAPIDYNDKILFSLKHCEKIFSRFHENNLVKQFLIREMDNKVIICAKIREEFIKHYLNKLQSCKNTWLNGEIYIDRYFSFKNTTTYYDCYTDTFPLSFNQICDYSSFYVLNRYGSRAYKDLNLKFLNKFEYNRNTMYFGSPLLVKSQ
jgi:hypothetical protein